MQGKQTHQRELFSTIDLESFIPIDVRISSVVYSIQENTVDEHT